MLLTLNELFTSAIVPASALLPDRMTNARSVGMLIAIALQESGLNARAQMNNGPARSFWQFEQGGIGGVLKHPASIQYATMLAKARGITDVTPLSVWKQMETDDVLGAGFARLLLWTDPKPLPALTAANDAWNLYQRCWRPGKPRPQDWAANFKTAATFTAGL